MYKELGWLSLILITLNATLYIQNLFNPYQGVKRVKNHCTLGKITIITVLGHLISQPELHLDPMEMMGGALYLGTILSGIILFYGTDLTHIRYQARSLHPALALGLLIWIFIHVLTNIGIL